MTLYQACSDFFDAINWNFVIDYADDYSWIHIELIDIVTVIVGVVLIVSMFKLFGIVLKKVFR